MQSHNYSVQKNNKNSLNWYNQFEELLEYKKQYGNCNVPKRYDKNQPLANWVKTQRTRFKETKLSRERINMLNGIGFNWRSVFKASIWNDKFEELKQYKSKHGDCNVPQKYDKNQPLAAWVHKQRFQFNHSKLSEERINMLNTIGFSWTANWRSVSKDQLWTDKFEQLKQYKSKHGDCNIPAKYDENQTLANWVLRQRFQFKQSILSEERINILNTVGFNWTAHDKVWNDKFEELKLYKSKHGDCKVPARYDKNQPLANWVQTQRFQFNYSKLSEERINILNTVDFNWGGSHDKIWNNRLEELKLYKSKHGHCNVPVKYYENQPLASWVHYQRARYKHSKMSEEHIAMLNDIGFNWQAVSTHYDSIWNQRFEQLKQYKSKYGDCNVPSRYDENQTLANWVHLQRSYFKHSMISKKHITMLNGIGFSWTEPKRIDKPRQLKNHEQIEIETSYQDSKEKEEQLVDNEIDTEQEDSDIKEYHEQIAIETEQEDTELKLSSLHHICSSLNPSEEVISDIVKRQGLGALKKQDSAGITASQYLSENPFTEIKEQQIVKRYILDMMGEVDKGVNMNEETRKRPREDINDTEIGQAPKVMKQNTCIEEADNNNISSSTSQGLVIGVDLQPVLFRSKKESMWWPALATTSIKKLIFTKLDTKVKFQMLKMNRDAFKSNTQQGDKLIYVSRFLFQHHPEDQQPMHIISKDQQHDLICDFFDQSFVCENEEGPRGEAVNVAISWGCDSKDDTVGPMEHSGCVGKEALDEEKNECKQKSEDTRENLRRLEQENNEYKMKAEEQSKNIQQLEEEKTFLKQKTEEQHSSIEKLTRLQDLSNGLKAELECPICFDPFDNPYVNPECAHRFCYRCIMESISKSGKECPLCRVKISSKRVLRKDELIGSITNVVFRDDEIN